MTIPDTDTTDARLRHEIEQLRTRLEQTTGERDRLLEERQRLSARMEEQARGYADMRGAHDRLLSTVATAEPGEDLTAAVQSQTEEELRVAFEELQVMTEELEASNQGLRDANAELDRRVEERTRDLARVNGELRASEASFRAVANLIPDLVLRAGRGGDAQWCNDRWTDFTGQDGDALRGLGWLAPVHPAERAQMRGAWRRAIAGGEGFARECRLRNRDNTYRWFLVRFEPTRDEAGEVKGWYGAVTDMHEQRTAFGALEASEARFRTLIEGIPQLVWRSRADGQWTWSSPQWTRYTGQATAASLGHGWLRVVHAEDRDKARAVWAATHREGPLDMDLRILNAAENRYRHFRIRATPVYRDGVHKDGGRVLEWLGTSTDVDDMLQLQHRQGVLVAELQHRTRNIMAVVRLLVGRTAAGSASLEEFRARIDERLAALSRVQGLLSRRPDGVRITFDELLRAELSAHVTIDPTKPGTQVRLDGPEGVGLRSAKVQTFALALHELATNALKYGALSTPDGRLDVSWTVEDGENGQRLTLDWRETGVGGLPEPGAAPRGSGYGRQLIEKALPYQLGARTEFRFEPGGVHCVIEVPLP